MSTPPPAPASSPVANKTMPAFPIPPNCMHCEMEETRETPVTEKVTATVWHQQCGDASCPASIVKLNNVVPTSDSATVSAVPPSPGSKHAKLNEPQHRLAYTDDTKWRAWRD
jgi:hypothetical protein